MRPRTPKAAVIPADPVAPAALASPAPRLYALHPLLVGPLPAWDAALAHAAGLGFDAVLALSPFAPGGSGDLTRLGDPDRPHPVLEAPGDAAAALADLTARARVAGLALYLDVALDRAAADGGLVAAHPDWFGTPTSALPPDPRRPPPEHGVVAARWDDPAVAEGLGAAWEARLRGWAAAGVAGLVLRGADHVPPTVLRRLAAAGPRLLAWTPGVPAEVVTGLAGTGLATTFSSLAWWDLRAGWFAEEAARLAAVAPAIATVEAPFGPRLAATHDDPAAAAQAARRHLVLAAATGAGLLVPMGFEYGARRPLDPARDRAGDWALLRDGASYDLSAELRAANAVLVGRALAPLALLPLTGPGAPAAALLRTEGDARQAGAGTVVVANPDLHAPAAVPVAALLPGTGGRFGALLREGAAPLVPGDAVTLAPGEALAFAAEPAPPVLTPPAPPPGRAAMPGETAIAAACTPRIGIEAVAPAVDAGRFPVKRTLGGVVEVTCDLICDGHDKLGAALQWRAADEETWQEVRLAPLGNDAWSAAFPLRRLGRHVYRVQAWRDAFATFRDELQKKHAAGLKLSLELEEGRLLVAAAGARDAAAVALATRLQDAAEAERLTLLLAPETAALMATADDRPFGTYGAEVPVDAERTAAGFASWYEVFPRSQSGVAGQHGTFDDVIRTLPRVRAMGFDVLYFPPIHPIGRQNRKGRNNSLTPSETDPGSPYAIGSEAGGHDAVHPDLGTLDDFRRLLAAAAAHGLEVALDFAIQCSPDHPWLREHRDWFDWRPDGSIRYAENPPKKYEDIVNVDFYAAGAVPGLWTALRDVVLFWCREGVRTFRVDNPHTKAFPFWEWMIGEVRGQYPDAIFLAEAFTRPKVMYRLAKVGFSQSYTYFTWRNEKREIMEYSTELATTAPRDFFRPHFFVNTPDINPIFLHDSGRPGFLIRAALAATLSGLWGVYQGFELCEARAVPGKEEYLDSDKYEIKAWPDRAPGDIVDEITRLNAIRRGNPALHTQLGVAFHNAFNDQVLWYRKGAPGGDNVILCAVSLDPHHAQEASVEVPLWEWGLPDDAALEVEDLMRGTTFTWHGKAQRLRLDPDALPFGLWRVRPAGGAR